MNVSTAGRLGRTGFLAYTISAAVFSGLISLALWRSGISLNYEAISIFAILAATPVYVPAIIRRLHDIGWSGWFWWIFYIPGISWFLLITLLIWPGSRSPNRYGIRGARQSADEPLWQPQGLE
ncbi:MAG: DUF805 domain-containing protein [Hyphomonadaceae bacterium]|nr:DUF805 domain-containing protein [Hyphomonadaceae bacterium]